MRSLPAPINPPGTEVVIDRLPGRKLPREQTPLAAGADEVEDTVQDLASGPFGRPTAGLGSRNEWF